MNREASAPCQTGLNTGMAWSVMTEISERLERLATSDESSAIDLRSLPLTESDRVQLEAMLGQGEVTAHLDVAGRSEIRETAFPGVWWIRHMGAGDQVSSEEIAITRLPEILVTHPADVRASVGRIRQTLESSPVGAQDLEQEATNV